MFSFRCNLWKYIPFQIWFSNFSSTNKLKLNIYIPDLLYVKEREMKNYKLSLKSSSLHDPS